MGANETQVGGDHYKKQKIQHWDFVAANDLDYFQGQITKYVSRWKDKNGLQDLYKAKHFLDKYIEVEEAKMKEDVAKPKGEQEIPGVARAMNWTPWTGDSRAPVPDDTVVEVKFRDGTISKSNRPSRWLDWAHHDLDWDIVAYRVLHEPVEEPELSYIDPDLDQRGPSA